NQRHIRLPSLRRKARNDVAEVRLVERRVLVDLPREKALAERTEWNESDSEFFERRQQFFFRASPPQRVLALDSGNWLHCVCAADRLHPCFRQAEVFDLALRNQILHRSRHFLDRHGRVNTMLIEEINRLDSQSLQ